MKSVLIVILVCAGQMVRAGEGEKYKKVIVDAIPEIFNNDQLGSFDATANKFTRIGDAERNQWVPYYYAALTHIFKSFKVSDMSEKDIVLDYAHASLDKAEALSKDNSEIVALRGFINMIKFRLTQGLEDEHYLRL